MFIVMKIEMKVSAGIDYVIWVLRESSNYYHVQYTPLRYLLAYKEEYIYLVEFY